MQKAETVLSIVHFSNLEKWSVNMSAFEKMHSPYPLVALSKVLERVKEPVNIADDRIYKRITVRLYGQGVLKRDELKGSEIGTKRQFVAHAGQLILSRIDARNGAFGIVPEELDGAIVTNDFWLFEVENALPQFLMLVLSSERFQQYWQAKSSGTTNRQRVDEEDFLNSFIPLPHIETQHIIIAEYNALLSKAKTIGDEAKTILGSIDDYLMQALQLFSVEIKEPDNKLLIVPYKNLPNKWEWSTLAEAITISLSECRFPIKALNKATHFVNRSWKKASCELDIFNYIEIGGVDPIENIATSTEVSKAGAPSRATQTVKCGDLLIGTTRPYLKRFAIIQPFQEGFVCSSGFQVIEKNSEYDLRYILEVLKLDPIIKQFELLMTGALYPAVNVEQLSQIRIPIPPLETQQTIANDISKSKRKARVLNKEAERLRQYAMRAFEEAVFGEA